MNDFSYFLLCKNDWIQSFIKWKGACYFRAELRRFIKTKKHECLKTFKLGDIKTHIICTISGDFSYFLVCRNDWIQSFIIWKSVMLIPSRITCTISSDFSYFLVRKNDWIQSFIKWKSACYFRAELQRFIKLKSMNDFSYFLLCKNDWIQSFIKWKGACYFRAELRRFIKLKSMNVWKQSN